MANGLIGVLNDEKTTDEQIRQKIKALLDARNKAREELRQTRRELREILTDPRQEAILVIMQILD